MSTPYKTIRHIKIIISDYSVYEKGRVNNSIVFVDVEACCFG